MEINVAIGSKFKIGIDWKRKRKSIKLGWLLLQIKTGQYIPLKYARWGIYKYR